MIVKAKYKICKRLGAGVFEKCQTQKFTLSESRAAANSKKRRPNVSEFGTQLLEKQKARYTYGLSERQFGNYVKSAVEKKGAHAVSSLIASLESRLDNVVYRLGLASTRRLARQLVSHGHITVNSRRVSIPSYQVAAGDVVSVREGSKARTYFAALPEKLAEVRTPEWLSFDASKMEGKVLKSPERMDETLFNPAVVIQFYSR